MKQLRQCSSCGAWGFGDPDSENMLEDLCGRCGEHVNAKSVRPTLMNGLIVIGALILFAVFAALGAWLMNR
jgi:hypothetical protein